ncbi:hypothetical protein P7K49_023230 [Saguinus oedipus]|uniref:Uncharacterized protein n=1 Tax=Saguinus oedipus TaxID=9490 RepID=A0ABQ9ULW1_SAGOE|nr:hypothetical protein P7K49_023230 [Saguinus oedipus]
MGTPTNYVGTRRRPKKNEADPALPGGTLHEGGARFGRKGGQSRLKAPGRTSSRTARSSHERLGRGRSRGLTRESSAEARHPPQAPSGASSPEPIRKQPSGSGNCREDPEAVRSVTRECENPPFALRPWRQLRRWPRAKISGGGG